MSLRGAFGRLRLRLARLSRRSSPLVPTATHLHRGDGIDWNEPAIARSLEILRGFKDEFGRFPAHASGASLAYHYANPYFGLVDAAVLHSFVRERRPSVVVEVGSGFSSRVIRQALELNGRGRLISIDPEPRAAVDGIAHEFRRQAVQEIPLAFFEALPADAILFIDSSHRCGAASDVNFLLLEVLPSLPAGVLVQVHDIYLPEDYPATWNIDQAWGYTEQYLLHALLAHSSAFAITWPGRYCVREHPAVLEALFSRLQLGLHCSFWFERTDQRVGTQLDEEMEVAESGAEVVDCKEKAFAPERKEQASENLRLLDAHDLGELEDDSIGPKPRRPDEAGELLAGRPLLQKRRGGKVEKQEPLAQRSRRREMGFERGQLELHEEIGAESKIERLLGARDAEMRSAMSARSFGRPVARLFTTKSALPMTGGRSPEVRPKPVEATPPRRSPPSPVARGISYAARA